MERTTIDLWVGVFVALGIAAIFGLALKVGNLTSSNLGDTYMVTAAFENIGGLKPRAPVKSAGVVIGRVIVSILTMRTMKPWSVSSWISVILSPEIPLPIFTPQVCWVSNI